MGIEIKMALGTPSEQELLMDLIDAPEWVSDDDTDVYGASFWRTGLEY